MKIYYHKAKRKISWLISDGLLLLCTISAVYPPLRTVGDNAWVCLLSLIGWLLISLAHSPRFFLHISFFKFCVYIFIGYTLLVPYLFQTVTLSNRYIALLMFPLGYIIYMYYMSADRKKELKYILIITCVFAAITWIRTTYALVDNGSISRSIKSSGAYSETVLASGVGGYEFIYFMCILSPIALVLAFCSNNKAKRFFYLVIWTGCIIIIILSNYFTALILAFVSAVVAVCLHYGRKNFVVFIIVSVGIIILLIALSDKIVELIIAISADGKTALRLQEEGSLLGNIIEEFTNDRWPTLLTSINSWIAHPAFGVVINQETVSGMYLQNVGQHSHLLDTFAIFGTIVGILNCYILFKPFQYMMEYNKKKNLIYSFLIAYIGVLLFNNATPSLAIVAYLIIPLVLDGEKNVKIKQ